MSTVTLKKVSHTEPQHFRIRYNDAQKVLGPARSVPENDELPTLKSSSKVAVIGAGFAGIGVGINLIKDLAEQDFVIFEKHRNFGGTWWANTYPGCASDIPALWYSYFRELNSNWSRIQPPQYEMEEYILLVVEKYQLRDHAKFGTVITKAHWDDNAQVWELSGRNLDNGQKFVHIARVLASCQGGLVVPKQLQAKGLDDFQGVYMHLGIWNHDVDFKNKRVVVVGNGCSANQVVPALLKDYEVKSIFQISRSRHYIMPPLPWLVYFFYRLLSFSRFGLVFVRWVVATVAESRFPLFKGNVFLAKVVAWINRTVSLHYMRKAPAKYHDMIIPEFKIGCKRLIFDHNYIPSLHDPRLSLTNHEIDHFTKDSIILTDGTEVKADIVVACTGYDIPQSFFGYDIIGRNGFSLNELWHKQGVSAYKTVLPRNCPNFFFIGGPNSATGHSSVVLAIENGCAYFKKVAGKVLDGTYASVTVKDEVYDNWFTTVQKELSQAVFGSPFGGCTSWYRQDGVNSTVYPWSQIQYWWTMRHPSWKDLDVVKPKEH